MIEREMEITTHDGQMPTWIYHPEHDGPHPIVLYLMDAPSIRPALKDMAIRLASAGYYVMLPYLFYRGGPFREFGMSDEDMHARKELMDQLTPTNILSDADALIAIADADGYARAGDFATVGFCMSGGLAISIARAMPERVAAAASIHGAWMVRDSDDSPHLRLGSVRGEVYLGWADNDPVAPPDTMQQFTDALYAAGVRYVLDVVDAQHGYAPPGSPRYNRDASELHWERVHALLHRTLRTT